MASPAPPQGGLSDDQLLAAPGPTDAQLLAAPGPNDDALLAAPGPSAKAPPAQPGLLTRLVGIGERGMVGGVDGLVNTAQAAGRWADNHTFHDPVDDKIDNFPVAKNLDQALEADHPYAPQEATGKILQGAISGVTGGALTGGIGVLPAAIGAGVGAAVPTAKALGASDQVANDIGIGLSLLPVAGATVQAARGLAGNAVRSYTAGRAASNMTDEDAVHTVLMNNAIKQIQGSATGPTPTGFQAAGAYKKDLENVLSQYSRTGQRAGVIDNPTAQDLGTASSQAGAHTNTLSKAPGSAYEALSTPGALPDAHLPVVQTTLNQLDATSPQQFKNASAGPFASAASAVAPYVGMGSAVGSAVTGHFGPALDAAAGGVVGRVAGTVLPAVGRAADHLLGTAITPAEANYAGALRRVQQNGLTVPSAPLTDARGLIADNQQLASDNALASTMANEADKQYLYQYADAQAMNRQFDMTQRQQRAYEVADAGALDRQITQGQNFQRAQEVGDATAMDRQRTQQQNFERAQQVGDATALDRQITQGQNFDRAQQVGDATAMDRQRTQGQNNADSGGNWLEKQLVSKFKRANPGTPVLGAAAINANDPQSLFEASAGRFGSPAAPQDPRLTGPVSSPQAAPMSGAPAPQQPQSPATSGPSMSGEVSGSAAPQMGPFNPNASPTGGVALAAMKAKDQLGVAPAPSQIHASANAVLDPQTAFEFTSGANVHPDVAQRVANHAVSVVRQQAQAVPDQASADVSAAMGAPTDPNAGARGPIQNQARWHGAATSYRTHATQMMQLATTPAEKTAISQIAAIPQGTGKQAIKDVYQASNPGADMTRFTPQLMKGI